MAGIRLKIKMSMPRLNNLGRVMPVVSGWWNSEKGIIAPMYMKPPKFRSTSIEEFTSSWRASVSARY